MGALYHHSAGEATVASCVVFDSLGARKADYRKFNIEGITGGVLRSVQQAERRYRRLAKEKVRYPTFCLLTVVRQVAQARDVLAHYEITSVKVIALPKGRPEKRVSRPY